MMARTAKLLSFLGVLCGVLCTPAAAQSAPASPAHPATAQTAHRRSAAAAQRSECVAAVGLCVSVPAKWQRVGDVFGELGFVAAEPGPGDRSGWPQLTVAALPPAEEGNGDPPSLDLLVDRALTPDDSSSAPRTLQRRRLLLNGADAQIVRVELPASGNDPSGAIEQLALIDGGDGFVYSIALHCSPQDFARLEPVFQQAAQSWRLEAAQPAAESSSAPPPPASPAAKPKPKAP
jgi:hypothetical protein